MGSVARRRRCLADGDVNIGDADDRLPVLRVNAFEACRFALWMQGDLPTADQWERAAGAGRVADKIDLDADKPLNLEGPLPDVAVKGGEQGPLEVGQAPCDRTTISRRPEMVGIGCRDMAGNGWEWMRKTKDDRLIDHGLVIRPSPLGPWVTVRGQAYYRPEPWSLQSSKELRLVNEGDPAVGFRVVVEPSIALLASAASARRGGIHGGRTPRRSPFWLELDAVLRAEDVVVPAAPRHGAAVADVQVAVVAEVGADAELQVDDGVTVGLKEAVVVGHEGSIDVDCG